MSGINYKAIIKQFEQEEEKIKAYLDTLAMTRMSITRLKEGQPALTGFESLDNDTVARIASGAKPRRVNKGTNRGRKTKYDWARGRELWDQGVKAREIAEVLGAPIDSVYTRSKRHWPNREQGSKEKYDWVSGRKLWDEGKTIAEIAAAIGAKVAGVKTYRRKHNWPARPTGRPTAKNPQPWQQGAPRKYDWEQARKMYDEGFKLDEIADAIGAPVPSVKNRRRKDGWPKRGPRKRKDMRPKARKPSSRVQIPKQKCPQCEHETSTNPCGNCNVKLAPGEIKRP